MKVFDLDNNQSNWITQGCVISSVGNQPAKSSLHLMARKLLIELFPTFTVCEEVPIYLHKNNIVYLDFYIPLKRLSIEVQGEQHFKYISFFHGSTSNFLKGKKLDREKMEWCQINGISLVYWNYNENIDQWKNKLI